MPAKPICRKCGTDLNEENWYPSYRKNGNHTCKSCEQAIHRSWRKRNPKKVRLQTERSHRNQGHRPFNENKECAVFLGVHVAERVLSRVFKDVETMPFGNPGYDFICNHGKKIDVKSACIQKDKYWSFTINRNMISDFFLCLAFDNREDLTPLHAWLLPRNVVSHLISAVIYLTTISKWDMYSLDLSKVSECCDMLRGD